VDILVTGRVKFPFFPVETGISSIYPAQPAFGRKNGKPNQAVAGQFP
jgi:hypothetical protein